MESRAAPLSSSFPQLLRAARRRPIWAPGDTTTAVAHEQSALMRVLPQRGSMLLLDSLDAVDVAQRAIRARRRMSPEDPIFAEHFPGDPVYPAALQIELLGQAGICAVDLSERESTEIAADAKPRRVRAIKVHHALLLAELHPGDETTALAQVLTHDELTSIFIAQLLKADEVCAVTILELVFLDR